MTQLEMTNAEDDPTNIDQAPSVRFDALPENVRYRDEGATCRLRA